MIPIWNELTQAYELPPNVYYGIPFPYFEVIFPAVCWLIITGFAMYGLIKHSLYVPCGLASVGGPFFAANVCFSLWRWEFTNIIWNWTPQVNYLAAYLVFLGISVVVHAVFWFAIISIHRYLKSTKGVGE